jgi:hypothetical protein
MSESERQRLNLFPMNPNRRTDIDPVEQALALHAKWRAKHGEYRGPQAWEDINAARDERTRDLAPELQE